MLALVSFLVAFLAPVAVDACSERAVSAISWRVVAPTTRSGWAWDVMHLNFVTEDGIVQLDDDCTVIHSGSVSDKQNGNVPGYSPRNAFKNNGAWWGGRKSAGQFYLGVKCAKPKVVRFVQIWQHGKHVADEAAVQRSDGSEWITVHKASLQKVGEMEMMPIVCDATMPTTTRMPATTRMPTTTVAAAAPPSQVALNSAHGCSEIGHSTLAWRVVAPTSRSGWAWDVRSLDFVANDGLVQLGDDCKVIHSGSVSDEENGGVPGYKPENAFNSNRAWWGGRKSGGQFYLGINCTRPKMLQSVQILQFGKHVADMVSLQRWDNSEWTTVHQARLNKSDEMETIWKDCADDDDANDDRDKDNVTGILKLSLSPIHETDSRLDAPLLLFTHSAFLSDLIADVYDLKDVSISSIDAARRLQSAGNAQWHIQFEGVGTVVADAEAPTSLQTALQTYFEPYGWQVLSASVDFKVQDDDDTHVIACCTNVELGVILSVVLGVLCGMAKMALLAAYCIRCRRAKGVPENLIMVAPAKDTLGPNKTNSKVEPANESVDTETMSVSTRAPSDGLESLEEGNDIII